MPQKLNLWFWIVVLLSSTAVSVFFLPQTRFRRVVSNTGINSPKYFAAISWEVKMFASPCANNIENGTCGGVIIGKHHVLTAAHCLKQYDVFVSPFRSEAQTFGASWEAWVFVGNYSQNLGVFDRNVYGEKLQKFLVTSVTLHEGFFKNDTHYLNDIAIVRVNGTFTQERILPLCKSEDMTRGSGENKFLVSGIGKDANKREAAILKSMTITENKNGFCDSVDKTIVTPESYICVKGKSACHGDSGGPLTYIHPATGNPHCLYGIVSHLVGRYTGDAYMEFVKNETNSLSLCSLADGVRYSNVSHYADWIEENVTSSWY